MTDYTILDIDNCISDDQWRMMYIDHNAKDLTKKYRRYHAKAVHDHPGNLHLIKASSELAFITCRPRHWIDSTRWWLNEVLATFFIQREVQLRIKTAPLVMRPDDDIRPSPEFKAEAIQTFGLKNIRSAFDDRRDVVAAYREMGVNAHQVFINAR